MQFNNNGLIPNSYILELIGRNVRWSYLTYDFKKAREEFEKTSPSDITGYRDYYSPQNILHKYPLFRIGKLFKLRFSYRGNIEYMTVGRTSAYCKNFSFNDVGKNLKPRIFKCDDGII